MCEKEILMKVWEKNPGKKKEKMKLHRDLKYHHHAQCEYQEMSSTHLFISCRPGWQP